MDSSISHTQGGFRLNVCSDTNRSNNPDNGKTTLSYMMMMGNCELQGRQGLTAQLTMEADPVAGTLVIKETGQNIVTGLGFKEQFKCVPLHIHNTSALHVAVSQPYISRGKQVALRCFHIRDFLKERLVSVHCTPTEKKLADLRTNFLNKQRHQFLVELINNFQA